MKAIILLVLLEISLSLAFSSCVIRNPNPPSHVINPLPYDAIAAKAANITNFDWRYVNGMKNLVTVSRNQHLPQYCGSCWAFSSLSALGDRFRIATNAAFPEAELAPQVLLNCLNSSNTCDGGDPAVAYEYVRTTGIPDETCAPYEAQDLECTPENVCKNCAPDMTDPTKLCTAVQTYPTYYVEEHGSLTGVSNMQAEILARGPIVCVIAVTAALEAYTGGIFNDTTNARGFDHAIAVTGWGVENDVPYWIVRNSWGTFWGELGWFKIVRGTDNLGIESQACFWATPLMK
jgi:cathepsin X